MRLSVIVPAFNEQAVIGEIVTALRQQVLDPALDEIVVVSDGSADHTAAVALKALGTFPGSVLEPPHGGKGSAVKAGVEASHGDFVAYIDADTEYPPSSLLPMLRKAERVSGLCVYRRSPDLRTGFEVLSSRAAAWLIRSVLSVECSDPQAGLKVMPGRFARHAIPMLGSDGWLFDSELLALAHGAGLPIVEHRGPQIPSRRRSARPLEMARLLPELLRLRSELLKHTVRLDQGSHGGEASA